MINTLILDLDGPILDGRYRHYQCYSDILTEFDLLPVPIETYWEMKRQRKDWHEQLRVSQADHIYNGFLKMWIERIEEKKYLLLDHLQAGAYEKLSRWRKAGLRLILVTMRKNSKNLFWQLDRLGLGGLFVETVVVESDTGGLGKANAVYQLGIQINTLATLWIGDTEIDIQAAREIGVPACLVACGLRTRNYLESLSPDILVSYLRELDILGMGAS